MLMTVAGYRMEIGVFIVKDFQILSEQILTGIKGGCVMFGHKDRYLFRIFIKPVIPILFIRYCMALDRYSILQLRFYRKFCKATTASFFQKNMRHCNCSKQIHVM